MRRVVKAAGASALAAVSLWLWGQPSGPHPKAADAGRFCASNLRFDSVADPLQVADVLAELGCDVLIGLEWTGENLALAPLRERGLRVAASERRRNGHTTGLLVLVGEGVEASGSVREEPALGRCMLPAAVVRVQIGDTDLGVIGLHAPPPGEPCTGENARFHAAVGSWLDAGALARKVGPAREGTPAVLMGDLNALPVQGQLRGLLDRGLVDAHAWGTARWVPTWPVGPAGIALGRLDYVLVSEKLLVLGAGSVAVPGSDHRAVFADIAVTR